MLQRMFIWASLAAMSYVSIQLVSAQNVSITGLKLGMSLVEAEAKLPPGFHVEPLKMTLPAGFNVVFEKKGDAEAYTIETVFGKVAYIEHAVYLPLGAEVDYKTYRDQLFANYGEESKDFVQYAVSDPRGPRPSPLHWQWDGSGRQLSPRVACPGHVQEVKVAEVQAGPFKQDSLAQVLYVDQYPQNADQPGCHVQLLISLERPQTNIDISQISYINFELYDLRPFIAIAAGAGIDEQKKKQDAIDAVKKRQGPPM